MENVKLDRTDLLILRTMQENGRVTNVELAHQIGISPPPCFRRVKRLEKEGYIKGYHAEIALEKIGYGMTVFIHVSLANHAEADLMAFPALVDKWPEVQSCYMLMGETDFILKVVARDLKTFQEFLTSKVLVAPNVAHVKSYPAVKRTKDKEGALLLDALEETAEES